MGRVALWPLRVVEHTPETLVTWMPEGTIVSVPVLADGRGLRDVPLEERWSHPRSARLEPRTGSELIQIFPSGRSHSLWIVRDGDHRLRGWYVNLEDPHVLVDRTISTRDGVLDIWIPAQTAEPEWKDEDELEAATRVGRGGLNKPPRCAPRASTSFRSGRGRRSGTAGSRLPGGRHPSCRPAGMTTPRRSADPAFAIACSLLAACRVSASAVASVTTLGYVGRP